MSQNIERFICRACGSYNVTYDPTDETVTCNVCGYKYSTLTLEYRPEEDMMSSGSAVAGTLPLVKREEVGYRRVTQEVLPHTHEELQQIQRDITELKNTVQEHDIKLEQISGVLPRVVVVEEIPKEEAKQEVEDYFKEHKTADIEALMLNLKIPVQTLVEIIDDLKQEGKIVAENEEQT